jgi:chromosome partitioning protein
MRRKTLYDVFMENLPVLEATVKTALPGLDLLPADPDLSGIEVELGPAARTGGNGRGTSVYFRDPDGTLLELISYP